MEGHGLVVLDGHSEGALQGLSPATAGYGYLVLLQNCLLVAMALLIYSSNSSSIIRVSVSSPMKNSLSKKRLLPIKFHCYAKWLVCCVQLNIWPSTIHRIGSHAILQAYLIVAHHMSYFAHVHYVNFMHTSLLALVNPAY